MSSSKQLEHHALIDAVAERYRRDGYDVVIEPATNAVPFDLGGYHPDLLVRKGDTSALVEVKTQVKQLSFDQLRSLAEEVARHEGWRFVLITNQDVLNPQSPGPDEDEFSWPEIQDRLKDADQLAGLGQTQASFLILWIAVERMLRHRSRAIDLPVDRLVPAILIRQLYSQGELTIAQFESALRCEEVRNRLVHGFSVPHLDAASTQISALAHELSNEWSAPSNEDYD